MFCTQNLFGPKMHLRMEFDSGVGPTCSRFIFSESHSPSSTLDKSINDYNLFIASRYLVGDMDHINNTLSE